MERLKTNNATIMSMSRNLVFQMVTKGIVIIVRIAWYDENTRGIVILYETGNTPFNHFIYRRLLKKNIKFADGVLVNMHSN
jgi:hypothetical protein